MPANPHRPETEVDGRDRRAVGPLHASRGVPGPIRSDNGPEFIARAVQEWITAVGAKTAFIEPGSPRENGYCESFNSKLRDELLKGKIVYSLAEARVVIEGWRRHYNTVRPHSSRDHRPPAPEAVLWPASPAAVTSPAAPDVALKPTMHQD
jgi:putative transposase